MMKALPIRLFARVLPTGGAAQPKRPEVTAFYVPWEKPALASLKAHVGEIDVFSPMWGSLVSPAGKIVWEDDPEAHAALAYQGEDFVMTELVAHGKRHMRGFSLV